MKVIVGLDGFDGSGKTTVMNGVKARLEDTKTPVSPIGRDSHTGGAFVGDITTIIKEADALEAGAVPPYADLYLRLARFSSRLARASQTPTEVTIWDRFVLNDMLMISEDLREDFAVRVRDAIGEFRVIHINLECDAKVALERIFARSELSPKERLGRAHLTSLAERYSVLSRTAQFTWPFYIVRTDGPIERAVEEVMALVTAEVG